MFRVLTVAREYGSGGGRIARAVAAKLGWDLLDNALIERVARAAKVDPELAQQYDERVDSWLHRVSRRGLWHGAFEGGVAALGETDFFDAETMMKLTIRMIEDAYAGGNCVIVGRGAQCVLQDRNDVFHVFIYAPWDHREARIRERAPGGNTRDLIHKTDRDRSDYVRLNFGCNWADPHLYDMLISSGSGEDVAIGAIICAMKTAGGRGAAA
jgi:cytidylate kinase